MIVHVLYFGIVRERLGVREEDVVLADESTVADLMAQLSAAHEQIAEGVASIRVAVNQEYVDSTVALSDNDEVAIIPPVSGG